MRAVSAVIRPIAFASNPESVGYRMFAGMTVVSARTLSTRSTLAAAARCNSARFSSSTTADPHRAVIFSRVEGCGTLVPNGIRPNRIQEIESPTSRHSDSKPSR
jgi:hypothetical protein